MARKYSERFLGNTAETEVHDLVHEKTGEQECQIDEIIEAKHDKPYKTLEAAHDDGYSDCDYCLPKKK